MQGNVLLYIGLQARKFHVCLQTRAVRTKLEFYILIYKLGHAGQLYNFAFRDLPPNYKLSHHHHHHCLFCLVAIRAATNDFHPRRSWAFLLIVPHVSFQSFISVSTVLLHVFLGLPLFRFPSGVQ